MLLDLIESRKRRISTIAESKKLHEERIKKFGELLSKVEKTIESQFLSLETKKNRLQDRIQKLKKCRIASVKFLPLVFPLKEIANSSENFGEKNELTSEAISEAISEAAMMNY